MFVFFTQSRSRHCRQGCRWIALFSSIATLVLQPLALDAREWTDASGKFRVEAEYVGTQDGLILLKKENGVTIGVPAQRLSPADLEFIRSLSAPAGDEPLAAAPGENPLDAAESAEQFALTMYEQLNAGNLKIMWDALPASYQKDVTEVVHLFGEKMDPELWNRGFRLGSRTVAVLQQKKQFIQGHPLAGQFAANLDENWDDVVAILSTLVNSDISDLDKVKTLDVGEYLGTTGQRLATQIAALAEATGQRIEGDGAGFSVKTIRQEGDVAVLEFDGGDTNWVFGNADAAAAFGGLDPADIGEFEKPPAEDGALGGAAAGPRQQEFVRIESRWVPKDMADSWEENVAEAKQMLNQMTPETFQENKTMILGMVTLADGVVAQLLAADSQDEFNQVLDGLMPLLGGMGDGPGVEAFGPGDDPFGEPADAP